MALKKQVDLTQEWDRLFSLGQQRHYKAGAVIYLQGEKNIGIIALKKGKIKNYVGFSNGVEKTLAILEAPAITGETAVIDNGASLSSAKAFTDVEVYSIPAQTARDYLQHKPDLMMLVLQNFARKIRSVHLQAESAALCVTHKLARMLVHFHEYGVYYHRDTTSIMITHEMLASFLSTTRPKITKALHRLEEQGLIQRGRGSIEILNKDGLAALYE